MAKRKQQDIPQPAWWLVFFVGGVWFGRRMILKQLDEAATDKLFENTIRV